MQSIYLVWGDRDARLRRHDGLKCVDGGNFLQVRDCRLVRLRLIDKPSCSSYLVEHRFGAISSFATLLPSALVMKIFSSQDCFALLIIVASF